MADLDIDRAKQLIAQREEIDAELALIFGRQSEPANGKDKRPDLSNTQYFLEALLSAGVSKDDPAVQRAMKFIELSPAKSPEINMTGCPSPSATPSPRHTSERSRPASSSPILLSRHMGGT